MKMNLHIAYTQNILQSQQENQPQAIERTIDGHNFSPFRSFLVLIRVQSLSHFIFSYI